MPWASEVPELIDELAGEKLPAALMDPILEERRARHAERRAAASAKAEALARVAELEPRIEELAAAELDELEQLTVVAHGEYTTEAWRLRDKLRACRKALAEAEPAAPPAEPNEPVEDAKPEAPPTSRPLRRIPRPSSELSAYAGRVVGHHPHRLPLSHQPRKPPPVWPACSPRQGTPLRGSLRSALTGCP